MKSLDFLAARPPLFPQVWNTSARMRNFLLNIIRLCYRISINLKGIAVADYINTAVLLIFPPRGVVDKHIGPCKN